MKKSLWYIVLVASFSFVSGLLIKPNTAFALTTGELFPIHQSSCSTWVNPNNLVGSVDSLYATLTSNSPVCLLEYPSASIPTGVNINSLTFMFYGNTTGNSGHPFIDIDETDSGSNSCNSSGGVLDSSFSNGLTSFSFNSSNCTNWLSRATVSHLNSGTFALWWRSLNSISANQDTVSMNVDYSYPPAQINISSATASPSAGLVTMNMTGDTNYHGGLANTCTVFLYLQSTNGAVQLPSSYVATIKLDSSYTGATLNLGNQTWEGFGYSTSVSTWEADNITLPYYPNASVYVSGTTSCYTADGNQIVSQQGLNSNNPNFDPSLNATPSAMQNAPADLQPDCGSNVLCSFQNWLYSTFSRIFLPNQTYDNAQFKAVQFAINNHVPFAYVNAAINLDFSQTTTATSTPSFDLPMLQNQASMSGQMYHPKILGVSTTAVHWELPATTTHIIGSITYPIFTALMVLLFIDFIVLVVHIMIV